MKKLIVATSNLHKVAEYEAILKPLGYQVLSLKDVYTQIPEIEENGDTFEQNALIKANLIAEDLGQLVLADDSGFSINALDGMPGVLSARFMGETTSYDVKNQHILELMKDKLDRTAHFIAVIAIAAPNMKSIVFKGDVVGEVAKVPSGMSGFGYDPIFYIPELKQTYADLTNEHKNELSHRRLALNKALDYLKQMEKPV